MKNHLKDIFIKEALIEANKAFALGEAPIGAVIVKGGKIIARAHNLKESLQDVTAHAEIIAIKEASKKISNWRLNGCDMYVTLEPCSMCAGAILQSRISNLYIGTFEPNTGACGSVINLTQNEYLHSYVNIVWLYDKECSRLLVDFFNRKRLKNI